ncbi:MAG: VPLPA-CTERM sorting domain-containing protein [Pelomonas sp.]|nr:VPLPA-CTERM sorting domain-containing protein [Roseateles sp.]
MITLPDSSTVTVTFAAINSDGSPGNFLGAYTASNPEWTGWSDFQSDYLSAQVNTIPGDTMLQLVGGQNETYEVTLSAPIVGPLMDIVSLGAAGTNTQYDFNAPFTILSQGQDYWGGCATCLTQSGNDLIGNEGSGTIQFNGTYSSFDWTVPVGENWHGFTFGIETTQALLQQQNSVPEPGGALLVGIALGGLAAARRRR